MPIVPPSIPRRGGPITRLVGRAMLRLLGWKVEGVLPDRPKLVAIVAPHSSNYDFLIGIGLVFAWNLRIRYLGKKELFRPPLGIVMRWLGGIPLDRQASAGMLDQVVDEIGRSERTLLGIAPEGTRRGGRRWKTGFYWIAKRSGTAILPVTLDWNRKVIGLLPPFEAGEDPRADLRAIVSLFLPFPRRDGVRIDLDRALGEAPTP